MNRYYATVVNQTTHKTETDYKHELSCNPEERREWYKRRASGLRTEGNTDIVCYSALDLITYRNHKGEPCIVATKVETRPFKDEYEDATIRQTFEFIRTEYNSCCPDPNHIAELLTQIPLFSPLRAQAEEIAKAAWIKEKCWGDAYL